MVSRSIPQKIVIVMPAYNAAKILKKTHKDIPYHLKKNIILADDGTVNLERALGAKTFVHPPEILKK